MGSFIKSRIDGILDLAAFYPLSLLALIFFFFIESLFGNTVFMPYRFHSEVAYQWYPYINFFRSVWSAGEFPLWSHNLFSGYPLAAFPHAGAFYPPFSLFMALDFEKAFPLLAMFHLMLRVLLMYGFLREWPHSRFASWLGAAMIALAGFSMQTSGYLQMFNTITWIPGIYWFSLRLVRRARTLDFLALTAFSVLGYLAGGLEILLYSWIAFYIFLFLAEKPSAGRSILPGLSLIASILICAAQFLLTQHYLDQSFRGGYEFNPYQTQWKFFPILLASLLPLFTEGAEASTLYIGFLLPAGFLALIGDQKSKRLVWAVLIIIFIGMVFYINLWPFGYLFNHIPIVKFGRASMRFRMLVPVIILCALPAAGGFETLVKGVNRRSWRLIAGFAVVFCVFQMMGMIFNYRFQGLTYQGVSRVVLIAFIIAFIFWSGWSLRNARRNRELVSIKPSLMIILLFLDLFTFSFLGLPRTSPKDLKPPLDLSFFSNGQVHYRTHMISLIPWDLKLWKTVRLDQGPGHIFACITNGLMRHNELLNRMSQGKYDTFGYRFIRAETLPLLNFLSVRHVLSNKAPVYFSDPQPLNSPFLKSTYHESGDYVAPRPPRDDGSYRMPAGSVWTIAAEMMDGDEIFMGIEPAAASSCLTVGMGTERAGRPVPVAGELVEDELPGIFRLKLPIADAENPNLSIMVSEQCNNPVKITAPEIRNKARPFSMVWHNHFQLYLNRNSLDLYGLYTAVKVSTDDQAKELLFDAGSFDPALSLIISPEDRDPGMPGGEARPREHGDVRIVKRSDNHVVLETSVPAPCYLSIAESYYPGWRAWLNGEEIKIIRANYAYQALPILRPGTHRIELRFIPTEFRIGLWISLVTIFFPLGMAVRRLAIL
jgi:hypothetical protein